MVELGRSNKDGKFGWMKVGCEETSCRLPSKDWSFSIISAGRSDEDLGPDRCAAPHSGAPAPLGRLQGPERPAKHAERQEAGMRDLSL